MYGRVLTPIEAHARELARETLQNCADWAAEDAARAEDDTPVPFTPAMAGHLNYVDLKARGFVGLDLLAGVVIYQALRRHETEDVQAVFGWMDGNCNIQQIVCFMAAMLDEFAETGAVSDAERLELVTMLQTWSPEPHQMIYALLDYVVHLPGWSRAQEREFPS